MPSTATTRNRFEKQGTGENANTWGTKLNASAFDLIDESLDGYESIAITGNYSLTSTNYVSDQARKRFLKFTGSTVATITLPAVSKLYFIWNATSVTLTFSAGGTTATLAAGAKRWIACTGTDVFVDTGAPSTAWTLLSTTAASGASVSQIGLADYNEVMVVYASLTGASLAALTLATSENNGSSYSAAVVVTKTVASGLTLAGSTLASFTTRSSLILASPGSGSTAITDHIAQSGSKANAIQLAMSSGNFATGTFYIYTR